MDIVHMKRYKMAFLGTTQATLNGLQNNLSEIDPRIANMWFYSLPYKRVEEFDYPAIAEMLEKMAPRLFGLHWVLPSKRYL